MERLTKDDFGTLIEDFDLFKVCSFRADGESDQVKQVTLRIQFKGATIQALAESCLGQGVVVRWQNGRARKDFNKIVDKSTVTVQWASPARQSAIDPKTALIAEARAAGIDTTNKAAFSDWLKERFGV